MCNQLPIRRHPLYRKIWHPLPWALLLALTATGVQAQQQVQDGRKLDNNLQAGSSGINPQAPQPDYRARNDLITGNTPGMDYFRGRVGYRAPGDFGSRLGDDATYRFSARSYAAPGTPGSPGAWTGVPGSTSLYRSMAPTSAGDVRLFAGQTPGAYGSSGLIGSGADGLIARPTASPGAMPFNPPSIFDGSPGERMGVVRSPDGRLLETTASPLMGVRQRQLYAPQPVTNPNTNSPDTATPRDARFQPAILPTPNTWPLTPAVDLGQMLQAQRPSQRLDDGSMPLDQRLAQIQAALFSPLGSATAKPGEDVYLDILNRIKLNQAIASGNPIPAPIPGTPGTPGTPGSNFPSLTTPGSGGGREGATTENSPKTLDTPGTPSTPGTPDKTGLAAGPAMQLESPDPQKLAQAKQARDLAMLRARGLVDPAEKAQQKAKAQADKEKAAALEAGRWSSAGSDNADPQNPNKSEPVDPTGSSLNRLVESLRYDGPGLMSLAGSREDVVNKSLRQAEELLVQGRYFDAEAQYRQAFMLAPGHPLARVGLVHAQMGAGLIRSSAAQLRALFEEHPELIGLRYQASVLPPQKRVQWIRKELEEMIRLSQTPEPALLLAYLGYQVRNDDLLNYGLDLAQSRAPMDPLFPLLRKIWLAPVSPTSTGAKAPNLPESVK